MNIIYKLGIILFVVLGTTNKAFCQKKREKIDFIEVEEKTINKIFMTNCNAIYIRRTMYVIRGLGCVTLSTRVRESFQDAFFLQYKGLNEFRENYNFPGYNNKENPY